MGSPSKYTNSYFLVHNRHFSPTKSVSWSTNMTKGRRSIQCTPKNYNVSKGGFLRVLIQKTHNKDFLLVHDPHLTTLHDSTGLRVTALFRINKSFHHSASSKAGPPLNSRESSTPAHHNSCRISNIFSATHHDSIQLV